MCVFDQLVPVIPHRTPYRIWFMSYWHTSLKYFSRPPSPWTAGDVSKRHMALLGSAAMGRFIPNDTDCESSFFWTELLPTAAADEEYPEFCFLHLKRDVKGKREV